MRLHPVIESLAELAYVACVALSLAYACIFGA
jgi:hypothetical protein